MLRDYQQRAIDQLYEWFAQNTEGHPCLQLPTGSGKSHIVAALCKDALQNWPETRILMLTHVKELIEQNAEKMLTHWPGAPLGIYSAGLNRWDLSQPITFGGIQSLRKRANEIGHIDLVIIDECHLINHRDEGGYRRLIEQLTETNPDLRVIGLTATPYRLGHGLITERHVKTNKEGEVIIDDPPLLTHIIEPVTIEELIELGYLAPLRSKKTDISVSVEHVRKRGGEYREDELIDAMANFDTAGAVRETLERAADRRSLLFFCTGVDHALQTRDLLRDLGVTAEAVLGDTPKAERTAILQQFKSGELRAITNNNVLTTGFDAPDTDCIAFLRPTLSPSLYMQMAGRGMRIKSHCSDCLVLDFANLVMTHGPVTNVDPGNTPGAGEKPAKTCLNENCRELNPLNAKVCSACGTPFPEPEEKPLTLSEIDIMGIEQPKAPPPPPPPYLEKYVTGWAWTVYTSRASNREMLMVSYYSDAFDAGVREYITLGYPGYAGKKALRTIADIARKAGVDAGQDMGLAEIAAAMNAAQPPSLIRYNVDGKFYRVESREWKTQNTLSSEISSNGSEDRSREQFESLLFPTEGTVH